MLLNNILLKWRGFDMENNELLQTIKEMVTDVIKEEMSTRFDKIESRIHSFEEIILAFNNKFDTEDEKLNKIYKNHEEIRQELDKLDEICNNAEDLKMRIEIIEGYIR